MPFMRPSLPAEHLERCLSLITVKYFSFIHFYLLCGEYLSTLFFSVSVNVHSDVKNCTKSKQWALLVLTATARVGL